ncbi:MAG TPA: FxLYD domain-containing protein [Thermoanaerobaculia bacterium]|nr:FxLYD domain-containing protein [Thermoanaerobaculia bacterium]
MRSHVVLALALTLAGSPAAADWLVTREGGRVETKGPWKVKGKLVVFTTADGALSSLRLADVDLEASERAMQEEVAAREAKLREAEKPAPPRRKSVRVVTDADVRPAEPRPEEEAETGEEKKEEKAKDAGSNPIVVSDWERRELPGKRGVEVVGQLENRGDQLATGLKVAVALFDEAKQILATGEAMLDATALRPGGTTRFRADFVGTFSFAGAGFDVKSYGLKLTQAEPQDTAESGEQTPP